MHENEKEMWVEWRTTKKYIGNLYTFQLFLSVFAMSEMLNVMSWHDIIEYSAKGARRSRKQKKVKSWLILIHEKESQNVVSAVTLYFLIGTLFLYQSYEICAKEVKNMGHEKGDCGEGKEIHKSLNFNSISFSFKSQRFNNGTRWKIRCIKSRNKG